MKVQPKIYPLGIEPKRFWKLERFNNLKEAIYRYHDANLPINPEWVNEYNELLDEMVGEFELEELI